MILKMVKVKKKIKIILFSLLVLITILSSTIYINHTEAESATILKKTKETEEVELIVNKIEENGASSKEIEAIAARLNEVFEFKLANQGMLYASYCTKKGVDPYLAASISIYETYRGASVEITEYNNVGGMRSGGKAMRFDTIEAGIIKHIDNLANNYYAKGLDTAEKMQSKYAGSTTWAQNVNYFYNKIKDGTYKAGLPLNTNYASSKWY